MLRCDPVIVKYTLDNEGNLVKAPDEVIENEEDEYVDMYQCPNCGVQFPRIDQYDNHACDPEIGILKNIKLFCNITIFKLFLFSGSEYKCPICESSFTTSQSLCAHVRSHKTGVAIKTGEQKSTGPFVCRICDTVFPTNKSLRLHRRMHDPVKAKEIEAPVEYGLIGKDQII